MKVSIDTVRDAANLAGIEGEERNSLIAQIEKLLREEKAERDANKVPRENQHVVVISGLPEGITNDELQASVFVIPQDQDPATLMDTIRGASVDQNLTTRKKKNLISTFTDAVSFLKAKFQKARGFKNLTKEWCQVLILTPEQNKNFVVTKIVDKEDFS